MMHKIHTLFSSGVVLLDEVDLILHPLKSELNWPLGEKQPLDMTTQRGAPGLRWDLPLVLLDAVVFHTSRRLATDDLAETSSACALLRKIVKVIDKGLGLKKLQRNPHVVVLDKVFYADEIMPLLARYAFVWLQLQHLQETVAEADAVDFMMKGAASSCVDLIANKCGDISLRLLCLGHDWLTKLLP